MTSSILQPQTMKRRLQSVVRRSLSKLRHEPPPVPPKDDGHPSSPSASTHSRSTSQPTSLSTHQREQKQSASRHAHPAIPPHYYHNYTQTECDGRHYEPSSPISPDQLTSSFDYDAKRGQRCYGRDEEAHYDLTTPASNAAKSGPTTTAGTANGGTGPLSLNLKDHGSPLIPRQELMVLSNPPPIVPAATTADTAIGVARTSSSSNRQSEEERQVAEEFKAGPVYGQSYGQGVQGQRIVSAFELDPLAEEEGVEGVNKNHLSGLRPAPKPPQQKEGPLYELKRKEVPIMSKSVDEAQWERRDGEHTWDFGELHATLPDDDGRGDIGKAISTEGKNERWTGPSSSKGSDDGAAYHHVSVPAEELGHGKGKDEYAFPRTVPDYTVDGTVEGAPAVVHETIQPEVHEVVQQEIHRDIHHYEEHYRIQPVLDVTVLPTRHIFIDADGNASELHFEGGQPPPGFEFGQPIRQHVGE